MTSLITKMNPLLIEDTFIQICYQIVKVKIIISLEELSKRHKKIIRKNRWLNVPVRMMNDENVICMLKTHNFANLDLSNSSVTDETVSKLDNIYIY